MAKKQPNNRNEYQKKWIAEYRKTIWRRTKVKNPINISMTKRRKRRKRKGKGHR